MSESHAMERQYPPRQMPEASAPKDSRAKAAFRGHLTTYLLVGAFLLTLNMLTSFGEWWFYWPLFFWGWGLIAHYVSAYGFPGPEQFSSLSSSLRPSFPTRSRQGSPSTTFAAGAFAELHGRIEHLKSLVSALPDGMAREQSEAIVTRANAIAGVLASDRASAEMVRSFSTGFVKPTEEILEHYSRLMGRGVPGAAEVLRGVEEESLPYIQQHMDRLFEQLHHRDLVQLSVANEMADFDLTQAQHEITAELDKLRT